MNDASQFTLGLFDNTALGWTVKTLDVDAPLSVPYESDDEDDMAVSRHVETSAAPNFYLAADRSLARGWPARARHNLYAIRLSKELEATGRTPTTEEQAALLRFVGFGASELAQNCFPLPGMTEFRPGWAEIGRAIADAVTPVEYAACNARPSMPITRPSRSSVDSGEPCSIWDSPGAASWNPAWGLVYSSRCCRRPCATAPA